MHVGMFIHIWSSDWYTFIASYLELWRAINILARYVDDVQFYNLKKDVRCVIPT